MIYILTKPEWREEATQTMTWLTEEQIPRALSYLWKTDMLAADSETTGFDPHLDKLFCIQLGNGTHEFIFDMRWCLVDWVKPFLEQKHLIGVNLKFDLKFWYKIGCRPVHVTDLMLNEVNCTSGLYSIAETKGKFSFKGLCMKYLKMEEDDIDKSLGKAFSVKPYDEKLYQKEILYSAMDVVHPLTIYPEQQKLIAIKKVEDTCDLENQAVLGLADMEFNGITIDGDSWDVIKQHVAQSEATTGKALEEYLWNSKFKDRYVVVEKTTQVTNKKTKVKTEKTTRTKRELFHSYESASGEFHKFCNINWNSPEQVKPVFDLFNIPAPSLDKDKLAVLKDKYPLVELYLEYGKYKSLREKFTDTLMSKVNPATGNIHTEFWQIVSTGRISASSPNLQQIPSKGDEGKAMRKCFVAPKGQMLVTSDISGAELRIIAELSQDPLWISVFNNNQDLHSVLCSEVFKIPIEDVLKPFPMKPEMTYRNVIKTINFGLAYGMTEYKLSNTIGVTKEKALEIITDYFSKVPRVREYLDDSANAVLLYGAARTPAPINRPRFFDMERLDTLVGNKKEQALASYQRAAMNSPIQGCNADWVKIALSNIYKAVQDEDLPVKLRLTVHDEIVTSCPADYAEEWKERQENFMIEAGENFIKSIPIVVDSKILPYWSK